MAAITPTDLDTLETAFIAAIIGITPTYQVAQAEKWKHYRGEVGVDERANAATRTFHIVWGDEEEADPGEAPFTNTGYTLVAEMFVVTNYNLPDDKLNKSANYDHRQVRDVLEDLVGSQAGLLWVNAAGLEIEEDDSDHAPTVTHGYEVAYFKARS